MFCPIREREEVNYSKHAVYLQPIGCLASIGIFFFNFVQNMLRLSGPWTAINMLL